MSIPKRTLIGLLGAVIALSALSACTKEAGRAGPRA